MLSRLSCNIRLTPWKLWSRLTFQPQGKVFFFFLLRMFEFFTPIYLHCPLPNNYITLSLGVQPTKKRKSFTKAHFFKKTQPQFRFTGERPPSHASATRMTWLWGVLPNHPSAEVYEPDLHVVTKSVFWLYSILENWTIRYQVLKFDAISNDSRPLATNSKRQLINYSSQAWRRGIWDKEGRLMKEEEVKWRVEDERNVTSKRDGLSLSGVGRLPATLI